MTDTVKCLVWDLDQTLWQGILLENDEPRLAEEIRDVIVTLDERGILQSVASRNDHDQAWEWLVKLDLAEYFVAPRIGWGRKSDSVRQIADELGFDTRTIAFIDDQPAERAEVEFTLPEIRCYPAESATSLPSMAEFTPAVVTADSRNRRPMYQAGARREVARAEHDGGDDDFLRSLVLEMRISRATPGDLARVEELTRRTSQMNATGVHYSDSRLRALLADDDHEVLVTSLTDRFGSHGAIGVMLLERHPRVWHLKLLATSCRVVRFGAGTSLLQWLSDQAAKAGAHLTADFRRTDRNRMMEVAYRFAGFTGDNCDCRQAITAGADDVQCLHLIPERQSASTTMTVTAPDLGGDHDG